MSQFLTLSLHTLFLVLDFPLPASPPLHSSLFPRYQYAIKKFKKTRKIVCLFELLILPIGPNALNMEVLHLQRYKKNILNILFEKVPFKNKPILCLLTFWKFYLCLYLHLPFSLLCLYIFPMSMSLSAPLSNLSLVLPPSLSCFSTVMLAFPSLSLSCYSRSYGKLALPQLNYFVCLTRVIWEIESPDHFTQERQVTWKSLFLILPLLLSSVLTILLYTSFRVLNIKSRGAPLSPTSLRQHPLLLLILR